MKIKVKIILIVLLVLGICGITIQQSYAYYSSTLDFPVNDGTARMGCNVSIDGVSDMFGYESVVFTIGPYADEGGVPYNYTLTIENDDNSSDLLFGYNHVFSDHLTFNGTLDGSDDDRDEYIVQFKSNISNNNNHYWASYYKYTLDCKQDY